MLPEAITSLYLCGACHHPVEWDHKGVLCDEFDTWFHIDCQKIDDNDYSLLGHSKVSWECLNCNSKNYSTPSEYIAGVNNHHYNSQLTEESFASIDSLDSVTLPKQSSSPVKSQRIYTTPMESHSGLLI